MASWHRLPKLPKLYEIALRSIVEWKHFEEQQLEAVPGSIKEDLLRMALLRKKCHENFGDFLHSNMRKLDISECKITCEDLEKISDCDRLRVLEMNPPKYHRYNHPCALLEKLFSRLNHLVKLHLQRNDGMTDGVVSVLSTHCPFLHELDVSGCVNLTDESIKSLGSLSFIRALNLSDTLTTDIGLLALGSGNSSKSLSEIKLNNCYKISDVGINALTKGCKKLTMLTFCGCPKVTVDCQLALESFLGKDKKTKLVTWTVYF